MAKFASSKHKGLVVKFSDGTTAKFVNGEAEVSESAADKVSAWAERHPDYEVSRTDEPPKAEGFAALSKRELVAEAKARGLDPRGNKGDLVARLEADDADSDDGDDDEPDENEESDEDSDDDSEEPEGSDDE